MNKIIQLFFVAIFCMLSPQLFAQEIVCKLKGTILGRDSKEILLFKITENHNFNGVSIPIINNAFEYVLKASFMEEYKMIFKEEAEKGMWRQVEFFPDSSVITFTLYSSTEFDKNIIVAGIINKEKKKFTDHRNQVFNSKISLLYDNQVKENDPALKAIERKADSIRRNMMAWQVDYIKQNQNIFSCSLLRSIIETYPYASTLSEINSVSEIIPSFAKKYPSHPYTNRLQKALNAIINVNIGSKYIDFSAPTIDGKPVKISTIINDKVAIIDLWASWCGPCIEKNKAMIPVYEKYKDKGFAIIGVAREFKTTHAFKIALERDKYPWLNLIELDNENGIWNKYNIHAGGSTYLVNTKGQIIAIDPNADQLDTLLSELLR